LHCTSGTMMNIWIKTFIIEFWGNAQIYHVSSRVFYFMHTPSQWQSHFLHKQQPFKQLIIFMSLSTGNGVGVNMYIYACMCMCVCVCVTIIILCRWRRVHYEKHLSVDIRQSDHAVKCFYFVIPIIFTRKHVEGSSARRTQK